MLWKARCVCETQMPLRASNSKDGQGQKDKYKDLVTRNTHMQYETLILTILLWIIFFFRKMSRSKGLVPTWRSYFKEIV